MTFTVEVSWREHAVYEVEAATEDEAISAAILKARADSEHAEHCDVESIEES